MASHLPLTAIVKPRTPLLQPPKPTLYSTHTSKHITNIKPRTKFITRSQTRVSSNTDKNNNGNNGDDDMSYLGMWRRAMERRRKEEAKQLREISDRCDGDDSSEEVKRKRSEELKKILEVSKEERDRMRQTYVVDRAAAAIAAARSLLKENPLPRPRRSSRVSDVKRDGAVSYDDESDDGGDNNIRSFNTHKSRNSRSELPGPDFWSWTPPQEDDSGQSDASLLEASKTSGNANPMYEVMEKDKSSNYLAIPFQSKLPQSLPPFQSFTEMNQAEATNTSEEAVHAKDEIGAQFSMHAAKAADALHSIIEEEPSHGTNPDGSRWWKETGIERQLDGVVCHWTLNRGVSADGTVEWEEKYWEAADEDGYKELGSEKSGRDAYGNIWHEYWKETMWQEHGLVKFEKTADKWGKNGKGDEWQEKWWEHYDASGKTDKWAHKWCSIDPNTQVEAGHAHVWHERWGEKYDGMGGSIKYTDKWAERCEGDAWVKWGDKWDENFDLNGHGVKQGETWWEGKHSERWNRTWGERHNGSGWVHKYGKSSSGEHWDTHMQEDTWYERYPHYGFLHCFQNSVQLRDVQKPSDKL